MPAPTILCPTCGNGRVPIPEALSQTLFLFRGRRGGWTARELGASLVAQDHADITPNGWSNRLVKLMTLQLLVRRREGKDWRYTLAPKSSRNR